MTAARTHSERQAASESQAGRVQSASAPPKRVMAAITRRAYARIGLLGNPSGARCTLCASVEDAC